MYYSYVWKLFILNAKAFPYNRPAARHNILEFQRFGGTCIPFRTPPLLSSRILRLVYYSLSSHRQHRQTLLKIANSDHHIMVPETRYGEVRTRGALLLGKPVIYTSFRTTNFPVGEDRGGGPRVRASNKKNPFVYVHIVFAFASPSINHGILPLSGVNW